MGFFIEDNLFLDDEELIEKRKKIMHAKNQMLQHFRNYVLEYLRKTSEPLDVEYELINNDPDVRFRDLKKGDNFTYERIYFKFNLQTELTIDYVKNRYDLTKLYATEGDEIIEDLVEGSNFAQIKPRIIRRLKTNQSMVPEFERQKIIERIQLEVDNILKQVFAGNLTFNDPKFEKLVQANAYLENEKREIDDFLKPKDNNLGYKHKI